MEDNMASILRRLVVGVLLAAWSFPAAAATTELNQNGAQNPGQSTPASAPVGPVGSTVATRTGAGADDAQGYAQREQQAPALRDFQGGDGYVYIGGGALTIALLVVLILILV
jgi:hypothetical protein